MRQPLVSIQRHQTLSLNAAAFEALGRPISVELLFDPVDQVIGLRPVDPQVKHAYPVRPNSSSSSYVVAGSAFLRHYGIEKSIRRRYKADLLDGMLTVDLKTEPVEVGSGPGHDRQPVAAKHAKVRAVS